jgi:putative oxidoreductase
VAVASAGPQFGPPGYETEVLYLACLVALVFGGAGPFAVDGLLPWRKASKSSSTVCMSATSKPRWVSVRRMRYQKIWGRAETPE